jgi:hypothetical protein
VWNRAWTLLGMTAQETSLGIDDKVIEPLVRNPDLLTEVERLWEQ